MTSREQALAEVNAGDIVFGVGTGGQPKLLLVYRVHEDGLSAQHITTQTNYRFDRNGKTRVYADGGQVTIVSTARLDAERFKVAIGLDRKAAGRPEYPDTILTPAEIELMVTHRSFFEAHLLSAQLALWRQTLIPLVVRVADDLSIWLSPAFDRAVATPDFDGVEALAEDRAALWSRVGGADFRSDAEKRGMLGIGEP